VDCLDCLVVIEPFFVHILFQGRKRQLITLAYRPILARELLHRIIGQMPESIILIILNRILHGAQSNIALLEYKALQSMSDQNPNSNIELSAHNE
jgi:hypothetical protein